MTDKYKVSVHHMNAADDIFHCSDVVQLEHGVVFRYRRDAMQLREEPGPLYANKFTQMLISVETMELSFENFVIECDGGEPQESEKHG